MSIHNVIVTIACDYCDARIEVDLPRALHVVAAADAVAEEHGWSSLPGGKDMCPTHPKPVAA